LQIQTYISNFGESVPLRLNFLFRILDRLEDTFGIIFYKKSFVLFCKVICFWQSASGSIVEKLKRRYYIM